MRNRDQGSVLLLVLIFSFVLAGMAASAILVSAADAKAARENEWSAKAFYAAEAVLARSLEDLNWGGPGDIEPTSFGQFTISATTLVDDDDVWEITAIASNSAERGAYKEITGFAAPTKARIPKVAAVYVSPTTVLTLNGEALELDGVGTYGLAVASKNGGDGENEAALLDQIDPSHYDNIDGLANGPVSVSEVDPVDTDALFASLYRIAETNINDLGTEDQPRITYHDGDLHLAGDQEGVGVLVVDGDLSLTGRFRFTGLVFVRGSIRLAGGGDELFVTGSLVATGDLTISGTANVRFEGEILNEVETLVNELDDSYELVAQVTK